MALIVQLDDGSVTNANSYIDTDDADDYFSEVGNSTWDALTTTEKEQNLVKAFRYLETAYDYDGSLLTTTQNTKFPRSGIYVDGVAIEGIPTQIKNAQCELALIASSEDLYAQPTYPDGGYSIASVRTKVAVVEKSTTFNTSVSGPITRKSFPVVDYILKDLVVSAGITLVRC